MLPEVKRLIEQALAAPKTHAVVVTYTDGKVRKHETRSLASAQTHVDFVEAPKLNRWLIDRETGNKVCIERVEIVAL